MQKNFENSLIIGLALTLGVVVAGFVAFAMFLSFDAGSAMFSKNPSRSMEPTHLAGDYTTSRRGRLHSMVAFPATRSLTLLLARETSFE